LFWGRLNFLVGALAVTKEEYLNMLIKTTQEEDVSLSLLYWVGLKLRLSTKAF
jgi:hypothetical protein